MDAQAPAFPAQARVADVFQSIPDCDALSFCVLDDARSVIGIVTMDELKQCLADPAMAGWVVVFDLMRPAPDKLLPAARLPDAMRHMQETGLECLPVVTDDDDATYVGMIEMQAVMRQVTQEVLRRRSVADGVA